MKHKLMKRILLILSLLLLGILLTSCDELERQNAVRVNSLDDIYVEDGNGQQYRIVVIEGCEFYLYNEYRQMALSKIDCGCIANKSNRNLNNK